MATRRLDWIVLLSVLGLVLAGSATLAGAHEQQTIEGYDVTFGAADEPVITGERAWLQVEIVDAETGEPVEGQADGLELAVQRPFGNDTFDLDVEPVHGRPGWYQAAVVFTEPGTYTVHLGGEIEGTEVDATFEKRVHDAEDLEYPERTPGERSGVDPDAAVGFGLGVVVTALAAGAAFVVGRRR